MKIQKPYDNMTMGKTSDISGGFWYYFWQFLYLIPIVATLHYFKALYFPKIINLRFNTLTDLDLVDVTETQCKQLFYEMMLLRKEFNDFREELNEIQAWKSDILGDIELKLNKALDIFYSDNVGMFDYASEYAGGTIISTPDTHSYLSKFDGFRLFGAFDWMLQSQPHVILQQTQPGKCYAFHGNRGRILIKLGRPVAITHVSLEHIRIGESVKSAPKEFEVLGYGGDFTANLGQFMYDLNDSVIQTFRVSSTNQTFESVELRILNNYGNQELTCLYRFRVHSVF